MEFASLKNEIHDRIVTRCFFSSTSMKLCELQFRQAYLFRGTVRIVTWLPVQYHPQTEGLPRSMHDSFELLTYILFYYMAIIRRAVHG